MQEHALAGKAAATAAAEKMRRQGLCDLATQCLSGQRHEVATEG